MSDRGKFKHEKIRARSLRPGDLIFSPRTDQLMLVLSVAEIRVDEEGGEKQRIQMSWLPLKKSLTRMETNVNPDIIYLRL